MKSIYSIAVLLCLIFYVQPVFSQGIGNQLDKAEELYKIGKLNDFFTLVTTISTDPNLKTEEKILVNKYLAMFYLTQDDLAQVDKNINEIMNLKPDYQPDLRDTPEYIERVNTLKNKITESQISSVSKKAENPDEAPASVLVVSEKDIRNRGYSDIEAIFMDLPGFDVSHTYGSTYSNIYQRGYRSDNTDKTLFLIDGKEENDLYYGQAYISRQYPISNIKRVEVIYGPASTIYGANAFAGVINIVTKGYKDYLKERQFSVHADVGYGTFNTRFADITFSVGKKNIGFTTTFRHFYSTEEDLSKYPEFNYNPNDFDTTNYKKLLSGKFKNQAAYANSPYFAVGTAATNDSILLTDAGVAKAKQLDHQAFAKTLNGNPIGYSNLSDEWYFSSKLEINDFTLGAQYWTYTQGSTNYLNDYRRPGSDNGSVWSPSQLTVFANYQKKISDRLSIISLTQYKISNIDDNSRIIDLKSYFNTGLKAIDLVTEKPSYWNTQYYYESSKQFRTELKFNFTPTEWFDSFVGVEFRNSLIFGDFRKTSSTTLRASNVGVSTLDTVPGGNEFNINDLAAYAQITLKLHRSFNIVAGGRWDDNRVRANAGYGNQFTPRLALIYKKNRLITKLIYSQAFEDASNFQKYSTSAQRTITNPGLKPEVVKSIEFSSIYHFTPNLWANIGGYYSSYRGAVGTSILQTASGGTTGMIDDVGSLNIGGVQAEVYYQYKNYNFNANYTFTNPLSQQYVSDVPTDHYVRIADIASNHFNFGVNAFYFNHFNINFRGNIVGERPTGPNTTAPLNKYDFPAISIFNAAVTYQGLFQGLDLQLNCNNILDTEYFDPGIRDESGLTYTGRTPQKGRNFMFKLIYHL